MSGFVSLFVFFQVLVLGGVLGGEKRGRGCLALDSGSVVSSRIHTPPGKLQFIAGVREENPRNVLILIFQNQNQGLLMVKTMSTPGCLRGHVSGTSVRWPEGKMGSSTLFLIFFTFSLF